jgi:protein subunit release factor B
MSKLLFTVPRKDLDLTFFRAGGNGGQKQNKTSSACRITHIPSGAVGESRDQREQTQNRKLALERLVASNIFQTWVKVQAAMQEEGFANIERKLDAEMMVDKLKIELGVGCKPGESYCDVVKA